MPYYVHSDPGADDGHWRDGGMRECARAERCGDPRLETVDGKTRRMPALTPRAFCDVDRSTIAKALTDLPALWVRVHMELGNLKTAGGPMVATSKTAATPMSLAADELLRLVLATLTSWEERVRTVARLAELDTAASRRRRDGVVLTQASTTLAAHLDVLLALPAEPMLRDGDLADLDGADAGLDVLHLAWRCHAFLTDTRQAARRLPTPCGGCGFTELREVLDDHGQHDGAKCRQCGSEYTAETYSDLAKEQEATVRKAGVRWRRSVSAGALDDEQSRRA